MQKQELTPEMEFLVEIEVNWPVNGDPVLREKLILEESERAKELSKAGFIRHIWRVPGRWANVGIWEADNATDLHEALSSLPFFPWLNITVRPLASHPNSPAWR
jgi:muconolactone D-isomerase